jgi:uncharacterized protein (TIGR02118 family)
VTSRLIAIYDHPDDPAKFLAHYESVHAPLVRRTPGLLRLVFSRISGDVFGGPAPYFAIAEMDYPDRKTLEAAMKSPEQNAVGKDLMEFARGKVRVLIADSDDI